METMGIAQIIGLVIVVALTIFGGIMIVKKSKKYSLVKWIGLFVLFGIGLSWVFDYGLFRGSSFVSYGMTQESFSDLANYFYYAMNFTGDKIAFVFILGAFYAVLLKSKGYKKLVNTLAENLKGKELIFILMCSLLLAVMTSIFGQTLIPLIFVPFIISVLLSLNLDKITAFATTFGSMLVGVLGLTYGGDGIPAFNYYLSFYSNVDNKMGIMYRFIILAVGIILFNFFTVLHAKKVLKGNKVNEKEADPFKVEKLTKEEEKAHAWPIALMFIILLVICVLGYVDWKNNFGINFFADLHEKVLSFALKDIPLIGGWFGKNFGNMTPVNAILGSLFRTSSETGGSPVGVLGSWNLMHGGALLIFLTIIIAIANKIKLNDFIEAYKDGFKKILLPAAALVGAFLIMAPAYTSPFVPSIISLITKGVTKFNPYIVSLGAFISNFFHTDMGWGSYAVANYFTTTFSANIDLVYAIFLIMYGFVGFFAPSSILLLMGLSYLHIDYKEWLKHSWMYILGMLVIIIVLLTVVVYI